MVCWMIVKTDMHCTVGLLPIWADTIYLSKHMRALVLFGLWCPFQSRAVWWEVTKLSRK